LHSQNGYYLVFIENFAGKKSNDIKALRLLKIVVDRRLGMGYIKTIEKEHIMPNTLSILLLAIVCWFVLVAIAYAVIHWPIVVVVTVFMGLSAGLAVSRLPR
jgi:predicted RND superfamily exporter protein